MQRSNHVVLQFQKPFFHLATGVGSANDVDELDFFSLAALHVSDVEVFGEGHASDALETLFQERLHPEYKQRRASFHGEC